MMVFYQQHTLIILQLCDRSDTNLSLFSYYPNRKYEEALEYHRQALVLIPQNASTYSAIGYIHSLMGNFESAIDYFHTVCVHFICF